LGAATTLSAMSPTFARIVFGLTLTFFAAFFIWPIFHFAFNYSSF
jgi:hypothetical protein